MDVVLLTYTLYSVIAALVIIPYILCITAYFTYLHIFECNVETTKHWSKHVFLTL